MQNPYSTLFGRIPDQFIPRLLQSAEVVNLFQADHPDQQVFVISGPRGCGKTVFMTSLERTISQDDNWVVEELSIEHNLIDDLLSKLCNRPSLSDIFSRADIDLSFFGLGVHIKEREPLTNKEVALTHMLEALNRHHKRLLVAIDEVVNHVHMREFASIFQMLVRQDLPIFLLMTGLYENVDSLQNERTLTFLYRAPKVRLEALGMRSIASNYQMTLGVDRAKSLEMAHMTNGYPFAFQLLGHLAWEHGGLSDSVVETYRNQLYELSYDKIWSELSAGDRRVAYGIASADANTVQAAREVLGLQSNQFAPYRRRLIQKGIIDGSQRGIVAFTLPLFGDYVRERYGEVEPH